MLRTLLLHLSHQAWLRDWMQNSPSAGKLTSRFVAGRTLEQALAVCGRLSKDGFLTTLDHLGENVTTIEEAASSRDAYLKALRNCR
jgi:proline dehydrogenase